MAFMNTTAMFGKAPAPAMPAPPAAPAAKQTAPETSRASEGLLNFALGNAQESAPLGEKNNPVAMLVEAGEKLGEHAASAIGSSFSHLPGMGEAVAGLAAAMSFSSVGGNSGASQSASQQVNVTPETGHSAVVQASVENLSYLSAPQAPAMAQSTNMGRFA